MADFKTIEQQLDAAKTGLNPAEIQGLLCGLRCHLRDDTRQRWLDELPDAGPQPRSLRHSLETLYSETCAALDDPDFGFTPLLPDDRRPLPARGQALSNWCQGFLYGLGLAAGETEKRLSELGREALKDLTEITRMDTGAIEESDENEAAFTELEEFLRVAVITLYNDLGAPGTAPE